MNSELSMDQALIEKLTNILSANLDREHFGVKELAKEAGLSRSQLNRKLQSITGKSTSKFIREFKLEKAMVMLQNNCATASEIAYCVGFSSPTYFNTCFHDYYGYPPGEVKLRNPELSKDKEEANSIRSINLSQPIKETKSIKKGLLNKRMIWINTIAIFLLSVFSYNLYQNYKDTSTNEILDTNSNEKSIGVLPFKNLSSDIENQYFADGVMDDILNHLAGIKGLVVKSRQSSEKYRDSDKSMLQVGSELGANYLLEGSVQKYKDSMRIIVQLIDSQHDKHVWSNKYDFELKQVFTIQSDISKQIASELKAVLTHDEIEQIEKQPTQNFEAYNLYIKGRFFWHRRTEEGLNKSIDYFEQAIKLDSTFAMAYAGLADSYYIMPFYINGKDKDSLFKLSKEYVEKALSIDKNNAQAHATFGSMLCYEDWNWKASEKELKLAIKLNPNYATAHQYYSELLQILGRTEEARIEMDKALELNPYSWIMHTNSAQFYLDEGLFEKAIIDANKAIELNKNKIRPYNIIMNCYTYLGKDDEAMAVWEESIKLEANPDIELNKGLRDAFNKSGMKGFWKFFLDIWPKKDGAYTFPVGMAQNLAYLGETEKALELLELAYKSRDQAIIDIKTEYDFKDLRNEPRFLAILKKLNLGDYE
jgi:pentatricopeptide repeat protein